MFVTESDSEIVTADIVGADKRTGAYGSIDTLDERADEF
jgi:hypothetical protein